MTTQHTPTPWHVYEGGKTGVTLQDYGHQHPGGYIAFLPYGRRGAGRGQAVTYYRQDIVKANAQFIVRACNAHATLVEALTKIAEWDHLSHPISETTLFSVDALAAIARAALAKVSA